MSNNVQKWRQIASRRVPMVAAILSACSYVEDDAEGIGTFCICPSTLTITYSPKFAEKNSEQDNAFILAHEGLHFLCEHVKRHKAMHDNEGSTFQPDIWRVAEEIAVNIINESIGSWKVPAGGVQPVPEYMQKSTEEIYFDLKQRIANGLPLPNGMKAVKVKCVHGDGSEPSAAAALLGQQAIEAGQREAQEVMKGQEAGTQLGELRRLAIARNSLVSDIDYRSLLRRYLISMDFHPKFMDPATIYRRRSDICLPNLSSQPAARKFVVSLDESGSISNEIFGTIIGVLDDVAKQLGFQEIIVQHFTTQVMHTERVTNIKQISQIDRQADGGTAIDDVDKQAALTRAQFHVIVTDGHVSWLDHYSLPTVIVRIDASSQEPPKVHNMIAHVLVKE